MGGIRFADLLLSADGESVLISDLTTRATLFFPPR